MCNTNLCNSRIRTSRNLKHFTEADSPSPHVGRGLKCPLGEEEKTYVHI